MDEAERVAAAMWHEARAHGQCARVVPDDSTAADVRAQVRRLARQDGIAVRTARMGDAVLVVRLDAEVWQQDAATMRAKLTPR